jgi:hypothetical protein
MNYEKQFKTHHSRYVMFLQKVCTKKLWQEHRDSNIIAMSCREEIEWFSAIPYLS